MFDKLDGYFVDGLLHVSQCVQDYFTYDRKKMALAGSRSGEEYVLGQKLEVCIVDIQSPRGRISLDLPKKGTVNWRRKKK